MSAHLPTPLNRRASKAWLRSVWLLLATLISAASCLATTTIYVSPSGNDSWSGAMPAPVSGATTGPKLTLLGAVTLARSIRAASPNLTSAIDIVLRGGTYELPATLELTDADSGTASSPLVFSAYGSEVPVLSGGTSFTPTVASASLWTAAIPSNVSASQFTQLYVGGTRRQRVRMPKQGYYQVAAPVSPTNATLPDQFQFEPGDIGTGINASQLVVRAFHSWSVYTVPAASINNQTDVIVLNSPATGQSRIPFDASYYYLLENVSNAPLASGEWHFVTSSGVLDYSPLSTDNAASMKFVVPRLETLVDLEGTSGGTPISNITFQGLTFAYTNWVIPANGMRTQQGAVSDLGAVFLANGYNVVFNGCTFTETGAYGLIIDAAVNGSTVENCVFQNMGSGGIRLGSVNYSALNEPSQWTNNCLIQNNIVAAYGQSQPDGAGILLAYAGNCTIENNEVTNGYYSGISLGWVWNYGLYAPQNNIVTQNRVWHIGQGVLGDLGGIYTLGEQPGTQINGNVVSDVKGDQFGGWGIYCDEGSASILIKDNLVYDVGSSPMLIHWGKNITIESNVFAFGTDCDFENTDPEDTSGYIFSNNVLLSDSAPFYGDYGLESAASFSGNSYVSTAGYTDLFPGGVTLAGWMASEPTASSANPEFSNPEKAQFTPANPSVLTARSIDYQEWSTAGRYSGPAVTFVQGSWWEPSPLPHSIPFTANFDVDPADDLAGFLTCVSSPTQAVQVSSAESHSPPNSLEFVDSPAGQSWQPLASRMVYIRDGSVTVNLWLWAGKNSIPWIGLRNSVQPVINGPIVTVSSDGYLMAGNQKLVPFTYQSWTGINITFGIGTSRTSTWTLTVTSASGVVQTFTGLVLPASFESFDWFGIAGFGTISSNFFVDDIAIGTNANQ